MPRAACRHCGDPVHPGDRCPACDCRLPDQCRACHLEVAHDEPRVLRVSARAWLRAVLDVLAVALVVGTFAAAFAAVAVLAVWR